MRYLFLIITFLFYAVITAQEINIDFESSNLDLWNQSNRNHWGIDTLGILNGKGALHHIFDSSISSTAMIAYNHRDLLLDSINSEWHFSVIYDYNPSAGNNWAVWLTSNMTANEMHPSGRGEGFILGVNYSGSDDIIKLWKQESTSKTVIITTVVDWNKQALAGKKLNFKVTRSTSGQWEVFLDTLSGAYNLIGSGISDALNTSNYFGVYYQYTSTQELKLWLDDFYLLGKFYTDTISPVLISTEVEERNELRINFSENIDTVQKIGFLLNINQSPIAIDWLTRSSVLLTFENYFESRNTLIVTNLVDLKGNLTFEQKSEFNYISAVLHDVVISEIMADPEPSEGLPECEYVELYNRLSRPIDIDGWKFYSGDRTPVVFENINLEPNNYIVITDDACESQFSNDINLIAVASMPTILNSGGILEVRDRYNQLIHRVSYSADWFTSDYKKEGGWALEILDVDYPCVFTNNWKESQSIAGGTPGTINSISEKLIDYPYASLIGISELSPTGCVIEFSESLDSSSASDSKNFAFKKNFGIEIEATPISPFFKEVQLSFSEPLVEKEAYTLLVNDNLFDCSGLGVLAEPLIFGIPQEADSADLLINEVLFESNNGVPEFIELLNNSDKIIDLKRYMLASIDTYTDTMKQVKELCALNYQLFPKEYLVFTENKALLCSGFPEVDNERVVQPKSWLSLVNDGGKIRLLNSRYAVIDEAVYSSAMHFSLLDETSGVSLERISSLYAGNIATSWHSSSSEFEYATPGEENSQNISDISSQRKVFIEPDAFSPDNDGLNDYLTIGYNFTKHGFIASVTIYSQAGILVKQLVNNQLCGVSGSFIWDGLNDQGNRLAMGYYIVCFEAWHSDGDVQKEKLPVLLLPQKK
jgi:hypothetical protein